MPSPNHVVKGVCLLLALGRPVLGQGVEKGMEPGRHSLTVMGGGWASDGGTSPFGELRFGQRLNDDLVAHVAFIVISRADPSCPGGVPNLPCGDRRLIRMATLGLRFEPDEGRLHPTSGGGLGWSSYGAVVSASAGARFDVGSRVGLRGEGALQWFVNGEGPSVAALFGVGISVRV